MSGSYNPFEQYEPKPLWDQFILDRGISVEKWLYRCQTVIGMWRIQGWLTPEAESSARQEIRSSCLAAGLDPLCIHCSKCNPKGD